MASIDYELLADSEYVVVPTKKPKLKNPYENVAPLPEPEIEEPDEWRMDRVSDAMLTSDLDTVATEVAVRIRELANVHMVPGYEASSLVLPIRNLLDTLFADRFKMKPQPKEVFEPLFPVPGQGLKMAARRAWVSANRRFVDDVLSMCQSVYDVKVPAEELFRVLYNAQDTSRSLMSVD